MRLNFYKITPQTIKKHLCSFLAAVIGMFLFCSCSTTISNYSISVEERGFDVPKTNNEGNSFYLSSESDIEFFNKDIYVYLNISGTTGTNRVLLKNYIDVSSSTSLTSANFIATPGGLIFCFWQQSNSNALEYALVQNDGTLKSQESLNLENQTIKYINLATNPFNEVVVVITYNVPSADNSALTQFLAFDSDGNQIGTTQTVFTKSDVANPGIPRVAISQTNRLINEGFVLIGQGSTSGGFFYKSYFATDSMPGEDSLTWYDPEGKKSVLNEYLVTCKATLQGLFAISSNANVTSDNTLATVNILKLYYLDEDKVTPELKNMLPDNMGNALSCDVLQYWAPPGEGQTKNQPLPGRTLFMTGLSAGTNGSVATLTANGYTFTSTSDNNPAAVSQSITTKTGRLPTITSATVTYAGISNGYAVVSARGSLWGGYGNFATGEVYFVKQLSSSPAFNSQVSVGPNGDFSFFWTDAQGNVQTYPSDSNPITVNEALRRYSPMRYQQGVASQ